MIFHFSLCGVFANRTGTVAYIPFTNIQIIESAIEKCENFTKVSGDERHLDYFLTFARSFGT